MEYKATLDWTSKIVIATVTILFGGMTAYGVTIIDKVSESLVGLGVIILAILLPIAIYVMCYLHRPLKYIVTRDEIRVKRPLHDVTFDIKEITDAYLVKREFMRWTWRTFGNGGLFGYYGEFRNDSFGDMVWYATQRGNYLMLETTAKERIVLTPDNTDMVKEIRILIGK